MAKTRIAVAFQSEAIVIRVHDIGAVITVLVNFSAVAQPDKVGLFIATAAIQKEPLRVPRTLR